MGSKVGLEKERKKLLDVATILLIPLVCKNKRKVIMPQSD